MGRIRRGLVEVAVAFGQRSVYFVGRYMKELFPFGVGAVFLLPCRSCAVEHNGGTQHIGLYKHLGIFDAAVHMAFCCEMYHTVYIIFRKYLTDGILITDVCLYESIIGSFVDTFQILKVSCVCQRIHVYYTYLFAVLFQHVVYVI